MLTIPKNKILRWVHLSIITIFVLTGCQKQSPPFITILTPFNEQLFQKGDTVKVQANLSDADILLGEYLTVVSGNNYSDTIIQFEDHVQRGFYALSKQFVIQTNDTAKITVGAFGGSSITTEKTVFVRVK